MNFCSQCGHKVEHVIPPGDSRYRYVCTNCGMIHYQNPNMVAGTLSLFEGRILLCKRAIEPRKDYWTLPGGFMENAESLTDAALRETREEALAKVEIISLASILSVPKINQVHFYFLCELLTPEYGIGEETADADLFALEDIPWEEIAFPTGRRTLRHLAEHIRSKNIDLKSATLAEMHLPTITEDILR